MEPIKESVSSRCVFYHRNGRGVVKYLFGRRSQTNQNNRGLLQFLGGKLKAGETPEDAFHREGPEEAGDEFGGFFVGSPAPLGSVTYMHEDGHTRFSHHGFLQRVSVQAEPKPKPRSGGKLPEHDAYYWLTSKQASRRKLTPGQLELLERAENALGRA